jgi:hypothetical protein
MFRRMRGLLVLALMVRVAHASPSGDVTKAFQSFVDTAGTAEPKLEVFIPPQGDSPEDHAWPVLPKDKGEVRGYLDHPKVAIRKLVVSKSGVSAWLAADITNAKLAPLRASAVLVKEATAWHVVATAWSRATAPPAVQTCKVMQFEWRPEAQVPAEARPAVLAVMKALNPSATFTDAMTDSGNAVMFGPSATTVGGTAIKNVFKKWKVTGPWHEPGKELSARAGLAGDLAWVVMEIGGPPDQCTDFRTFFVLAPDDGGWKLVHQHYSLPAK